MSVELSEASSSEAIGYGYAHDHICASYFSVYTCVLYQKIEGLDALVNLEELWLGKNKISKLEVSCKRSSG